MATLIIGLIGGILLGVTLSLTSKGIKKYSEKKSRTVFRTIGILEGDHPVIIYTDDGGHNYWAVNVNDSRESRRLPPGSIGQYMHLPNMIITPNPWANDGDHVFLDRESLVEGSIMKLSEKYAQNEPGWYSAQKRRHIAQAETRLGLPLEATPTQSYQGGLPKNRDPNIQGETIIKMVKPPGKKDKKKTAHEKDGERGAM